MQEAVTTTTTPEQDEYAADLETANADLRRAVAERHARKAVAPQPVAEAACEVTAEDCCGGSRMPTLTKVDDVERHPSSEAFIGLLDELRQLHLSKSQDYGSEHDPLANIRQGADFVDIESWRGCMVRIADKVQRLRTYCRTGRLVHEGVRDTLLDLAAYSLLAIVLHQENPPFRRV